MFDKKSYKLLKKLYKTDYLRFDEVKSITGCKADSDSDPITAYLSRNRLIAPHWTGEVFAAGETIHDGYEITLEGRAYVEQKRRDFWGFILPYAITTLIALSSLIVSIIDHC